MRAGLEGLVRQDLQRGSRVNLVFWSNTAHYYRFIKQLIFPAFRNWVRIFVDEEYDGDWMDWIEAVGR